MDRLSLLSLPSRTVHHYARKDPIRRATNTVEAVEIDDPVVLRLIVSMTPRTSTIEVSSGEPPVFSRSRSADREYVGTFKDHEPTTSKFWIVERERCDRRTSERTIESTACVTVMILPQVHLRKPCYDFYFL